MTGKALVRELIEDGFGRPDPAVFHRLVAEDYVQHNPHLASGRDGLLAFLGVIGSIPDNRFTMHTLVEDGPYVAVHALWEGNGLAHAVIDLFRIEGGLFREHWDAMQEVTAHRAADPPVVGPPAVPGDLGRTAENKRLVERLAREALVGGDRGLLRAACAPDLVQHDPGVPSGGEAFAAELGVRRRHTRVHRVVGEGDLVLLQAEGTADGAPAALYHLFRLGGGRVREHWSVTQAIPDAMAHGNGMF